MFWDFIAFIISKCVFFCSSFNKDAFPKPLSKEEEKACLIACKNGDEKAKEKLISHNLRLVAHIAKKYHGSEDMDDLISVGTVGLVKAISTFEPDKGTQLATYTARCIENEILMLLRSNKKRSGDVSINEVIGTDKDGNELTLIDLLSDGDESVIECIERRASSVALQKYLKKKLNEREYKIIVLRYGLISGIPLPQREVASLLKISRSYVSRIEKKVIEVLRRDESYLKSFLT